MRIIFDSCGVKHLMRTHQIVFLLYLFLLGIFFIPYHHIYSKESMAKKSIQEFTLKDLVKYALVHSSRSRNSAHRFKINHFKVRNAVSQFLPSLDLKTDWGYTKNSMIPQDKPVTNGLTLSLSETLYNNGANITAYRIAKQENSRS